MRAHIDDTHHMYVVDDTSDGEVSYGVKFMFSHNWINMGDTYLENVHTFFLAEDLRDGVYIPALRVEIATGGIDEHGWVYPPYLRVGARKDDLTWSSTRWLGWCTHDTILIEWHASDAPEVDNGSLEVVVDCVGNYAYKTGIDNDTFQIDRARLGTMGGIDETTRGTYFFDAFKWNREGWIP